MFQQVTHWCSMQQRKRWKYFNGDTTCECGQAPETTKHMLQCPLLSHPCTFDDIQKFNENARKMCRQMEQCGLMTKKYENLTAHQRIFKQLYQCQSKIFSTFLGKITKYNDTKEEDQDNLIRQTKATT